MQTASPRCGDLEPFKHFQDQVGRDGKRFFVGMAHGTMTVELYKP